jgi:cell division protein FtsB
MRSRKTKDHSPRQLIEMLRRKASPHRNYFLRVAGTLLAILLLFSFLGGEFGFLNLLRMKRLNAQLEKQKVELTTEIVDLEYRIRRLETDSLLLEKIARSRYGLAAEDELIIRTPDKPPHQP